MRCRLFVLPLALVLLFVRGVAALPSEEEFRLRALERQARTRAAAESLLRAGAADPAAFEVSGLPELPARDLHDRGRARLYRVPTGASRLLKIMSTDLGEERIEGLLLGAEQGGPTIFRARASAERRPLSFSVEMEELFPEDPETFTLKGLVRTRPLSSGDRARLMTYIETLAARILSLLESGLVPIDPDLIFGSAGDVRWIDTGRWRFLHEPWREAFRREENYFDVIKRIVIDIHILAPEAARELADRLWLGVGNSPRLPRPLVRRMSQYWSLDFERLFGVDCRRALGET